MLQSKLDTLDSKQVVRDVYYTNSDYFEIYRGWTTLRVFTLQPGETLELYVNATTNDGGENNNALWLFLYANSQKVTQAVNEGAPKNGNASVSLIWKETVDRVTTYELKGVGGDYKRYITPTQLQVNYKVYGEGYDLTIEL